MMSEIERQLLNAGPLDPPPSLRQRILTTAGPLVQPHESRLDAIWFSPRWRVAAVLVFLGVAAADRLSTGADWSPPQQDGSPVRSSVAVAAQVASDTGLGNADVAAIATQASLPWTDRADSRETRAAVDFTGVPE